MSENKYLIEDALYFKRIYENNRTEGLWNIALGCLKLIRHYRSTIHPSYFEGAKKWDDIALKKDDKIKELKKYSRTLCQMLFALKACDGYLKFNKKTGEYAHQQELVNEFDRYVKEIGFDMNQRFFEQAKKLMDDK